MRKFIDYNLLSKEDKQQMKKLLEQQKKSLEALLRTTDKGLDDLKAKTAKKAKKAKK